MEWQKLFGFFERKKNDLTQQDLNLGLDATTFESVYLEWLVENCTYLTDLPLGPFNNSAKLIDLYCQPQLKAFDFPFIDQVYNIDSGSNIDPGGNIEQGSNSINATLSEAMAKNRQLLFIASSGYGKTTLCRFLTLKAASFTSSLETETFPIYVPLKLLNHTQDIDSLTATSTIETLLSLVLPKQIVASDQAKVALEKKLKSGQCLLLFDGLDDIVDKDVCEHWVDLINQFAKHYSENYIIVTSNSYTIQQHIDFDTQTTALQSFASYMLLPFTENELEDYVTKHCGYVNASLNLETEVKPFDFIQKVQANSEIAGLCQNPMMLSMMVTLFTDKVALVTTVAGLFERYINQCLAWYSPKGCNPTQWQFVLERIAYTMQKNNAPYILDSWCKQVLLTEFDNLDLPITPDELDDLLDSCNTTRSLFKSIETDTIEDQYQNQYQNSIFEFRHKSFQNFLTAKQLQHKAQEGMTLVKTKSPSHFNQWHQDEQSILMFYVMLSKSAISQNQYVQADEVIHWLLSFKDGDQQNGQEKEALFCASELALYSNAVSNIAIERIQDELESVLVFEEGFIKAKAEILLKQLTDKYNISNDVLLTYS